MGRGNKPSSGHQKTGADEVAVLDLGTIGHAQPSSENTYEIGCHGENPNAVDILLQDITRSASRQGKGGQSGNGLPERRGDTSRSNPAEAHALHGLPPLPKNLRCHNCGDVVEDAQNPWAIAHDCTPVVLDGPDCLADPRDRAEWGASNFLLEPVGNS